MALRPSRPRLWLSVLLALALLVVFRTVWLHALGRFLIHAEEPSAADVVLVLAGDNTGNRILKGAQLVQQGFAPKVFVSGPILYYGLPETDLSIPFAVRRGYPKDWFIAFPHVSFSTEEEARMILPELRRRNVHRLIVVTSDYHTARSRRVYHKLGPDLAIRVVAAPDVAFQVENWWRSREGQKRVFFEYCKTVAYALGM